MKALIMISGLLLVLLLWPFASFALTMILWLIVVQIAISITLACAAAWTKEQIERIGTRWKNRKGGHYAEISMDIKKEDPGVKPDEVSEMDGP